MNKNYRSIDKKLYDNTTEEYQCTVDVYLSTFNTLP